MSKSLMPQSAVAEIPLGNASGFVKYFKNDLISGFLVFLLALPLCLGISIACGYPPIAGIFTAIIGSILAPFISNSELTIKGPAAGLIVIAIGCVKDFGGDGVIGGFSDVDMQAYRMALAVGVAAAALQIVFALFRGGILGEFFPVSAVHGMLAAIGVIIFAKQFPVALGVEAKGEPLELLREIPHFIANANPDIALIGLLSTAIMFIWPKVKIRNLRVIPAPLVVLAVAIPLGMYFDLTHPHTYRFLGHDFKLGENYLVKMPDHIFGMFEEVATPDFSALATAKAWKWVMMFSLIGSIESMLSAKAVDIIDPWKRKTSLDRDTLAVGIGNLCASLVGGLPMISEIVRSKANIDNGARTRFAGLWHGLFLLLCVGLIPTFLHRIPLAALAAMLVYTGFRLAHPSEFVHTYKIGREQLVIFVVTLVSVLATDLLIGIGIGIATKFLIHINNGVPIRSLFKPDLVVTETDDETVTITAHKSAVFSNWIPFKRKIESAALKPRKNLIVDLAGTTLVDHSVMEKLDGMRRDFENAGLWLRIRGLDTHLLLSDHELAARRRGLAKIRRISVIAASALVEHLAEKFHELGATSYTISECQGTVFLDRSLQLPSRQRRVRIEVLVMPSDAHAIIDYLRAEVIPHFDVIACIETVEVIRPDQFRLPKQELRTEPEESAPLELVGTASPH